MRERERERETGWSGKRVRFTHVKLAIFLFFFDLSF